jgi:epoxyqueuosine reductase
MTPAIRLAADVRRLGLAAGLDAVAICDARPFDDTRKILHDRAALGWSDGMQFTYRNPERSTTPASTLPGAAAIVVGARRYERRTGGGSSPEDREAIDGATGTPAPVAPSTDPSPPHGRVAMYAWIDHYVPLRAALGQVAAHLEAAGWRARVVADDNALVDRAAAVRAGLGWYGKNTNVLLPGAGSWFVLGSVLTDAPLITATLAPAPVPDGCGSCQRCLTACPTGALVGAGQLDGRRCLAWLLQAPGVFPAEFRVALGDRMYGCDDCQTVCPINRTASRRHPPDDAEAGAQLSVDILELLALGDGPLMELVGRWYIPGREARYVRRNALVVLGNIAEPSDPAVGAALERGLTDPDPIIRAHAAWASARLGRRDLLLALGEDDDPVVRAELARVVPPRSHHAAAAPGPEQAGPS